MTRGGTIEFDPQVYEMYFKDLGEPYIYAGIVALSLFIVLVVVLIVRSRRKSEELRLEKFMTMDPTKEERDGVPPPPDGLTVDRQPKGIEDDLEKKTEDQTAAEVAGILATDKDSWLAKLKKGMSKTRDHFGGLANLFSGKTKISDEILEQIHETLFRADVGVKTADLLVDKVKETFKKDEEVEWPDVQKCLQDTMAQILGAPEKPVNTPDNGPFVLLVVGVNGVGKTTSCGKLSAHFIAQGKDVLMAAADTFRAAAIDQIKVWGERLGVDVIAHKEGADPAAVAFDAVKAAKARNSDVLLIDTAGRLHSKKELMDELNKIFRVIKKELPDAPHETWLVIDATTGQNAAMQVKAFSEVVDLSGLIVTKLDGTAKGGVLVGISDVYKLPVRYIGVGEKAEDLRSFDANDYAASIF